MALDPVVICAFYLQEQDYTRHPGCVSDLFRAYLKSWDSMVAAVSGPAQCCTDGLQKEPQTCWVPLLLPHLSSHRTPEFPLSSPRNIGDTSVEGRSQKYQWYLQPCFEQGILPLTVCVFCFKSVEEISQWEFPCSWWVAWFLCQKLSFWFTESRPEVQVKDFHPVIGIGDHILQCKKNIDNRQM
jgi:hypothetical protein